MRTVLTAALLLTPTVAAAQPAYDPDAVAKQIAPFVDGQTVAVLHLRVSRLTPETLDRVAVLAGWDRATLREVTDRREKWQADLARTGVDSVFLAFTLADPQAPFAWIIPVGAGDPTGVAAAFGSLH